MSPSLFKLRTILNLRPDLPSGIHSVSNELFLFITTSENTATAAIADLQNRSTQFEHRIHELTISIDTLMAENISLKRRMVDYQAEAEVCWYSAKHAEEAAERASQASTVSQKAAEIADETTRVAMQDRDIARLQLEEGEFMSRYSDYAKDEINENRVMVGVIGLLGE
jgi:hypothetical protein